MGPESATSDLLVVSMMHVAKWCLEEKSTEEDEADDGMWSFEVDLMMFSHSAQQGEHDEYLRCSRGQLARYPGQQIQSM